MARGKVLGSPAEVLDRAIRKHLATLGTELIEAARSEDPPWSTMARVARSLARLGTSGPADALEWDASDEETARYYRILRELARA